MIRFLCLVVFASAAALAQPSRSFFPWWDMPIARDLNLSEDQQGQIRVITREYRTKLIDLRAQVEKADVELEDLFDDENFELQRAMQVSDRLAAARSELTKAFSTMNARLRGVLTAQQWRELKRRRPGPGGPDPSGLGKGRSRMRRPGPPARDREE